MRTAFKLLPVVAGIFAAAFAAPSHAVGGPSGLKVGYAVQGTLGETIVNPYGLAPLTAVIRNGGYVLKHATVRIVPKEGGQEIKYDVGPQTLRTHGGIPVFGLYAGWRNTVEVTYTRVFQGEEKTVTESYVINTQPAWLETTGNPAIAQNFMTAKVTTPAPKEFSYRLYFINNLGAADVRASRAVWNNPVGGALQWNNPPRNAILDTKGEIRWYMKADRIYDPESLYDAGITMNDVNPDYVVVGEGRSYSLDTLTKATNLVMQGAKLIGANSDVSGPIENGIAPACRALIAPIEMATGKQAYFCGKPNPLMMRTGLKMLNCHSAEAVMVGDRMDTDVISGMESGMSTVLVLSGVSTRIVLDGVGDIAAMARAEKK